MIDSRGFLWVGSLRRPSRCGLRPTRAEPRGKPSQLGGEMANEFYTLIVVPHAKARFRKVQVSVRLLKWVGGAVAGLTLVVMGVLVHYSRIAFEVHELRRLRTENAELREKTVAYEANAGKLQTKLEQLQNMVTKLGVMAGLEQSL